MIPLMNGIRCSIRFILALQQFHHEVVYLLPDRVQARCDLSVVDLHFQNQTGVPIFVIAVFREEKIPQSVVNGDAVMCFIATDAVGVMADYDIRTLIRVKTILLLHPRTGQVVVFVAAVNNDKDKISRLFCCLYLLCIV